MITYQNTSLFDAPDGSIIVHACNAQGMWGSGIAKEFAVRYPDSYKHYQGYCKDDYRDKVITGSGTLGYWPTGEKHYVGWIITSENYGPLKDSPSQILVNTTLALDEFCQAVCRYTRANDKYECNVYSNKFNSGLFSVPWEESVIVLETILKRYPRINWIVCDPAV